QKEHTGGSHVLPLPAYTGRPDRDIAPPGLLVLGRPVLLHHSVWARATLLGVRPARGATSLLCEPGPPETELLRSRRGFGGLFQGGASATRGAAIAITGDVLPAGTSGNAPGGARYRQVLPGAGVTSGA